MGRIPMTDPMFDPGGYPTKDTLDEIATWPRERGWRELMKFVAKAWKSFEADGIDGGSLVPFSFVNGRQVWIAVPCGWSGNEDLIAALRENRAFWAECVIYAPRGQSGPCEFEVRPPLALCGDHRECKTCINREDCGYLVEEEAR